MTPARKERNVQKRSRSRKFRIMLLTFNLSVDVNGQYSASYRRFLKHKALQKLLDDLKNLFAVELQKLGDNVYVSVERLSVSKIERINYYINKHYKGVELYIVKKVKFTERTDQWFED